MLEKISISATTLERNLASCSQVKHTPTIPLLELITIKTLKFAQRNMVQNIVTSFENNLNMTKKSGSPNIDILKQ